MGTATETLEGPETCDSARALDKMREGLQTAGHLRDDVLDRARREPVQALAVAFAVGIAMGALVGWTWRRPAAKV